MKLAILTANLGNFDKYVDPVVQNSNYITTFHRYTDNNFPPITGLTPRLQYRIPKLFGWEMLSGYDIYIWLDGSMSFTREDCVEWFVKQLDDADMAFFTHPQRNSIREEVEYIEKKIKQGNRYIISRYNNGLHKEQLSLALNTKGFIDNNLYASTAFIYRNNDRARETLKNWWYLQSRYYTCDQVNLPLAIYQAQSKVSKIMVNLFKSDYLTLVSHHK